MDFFLFENDFSEEKYHIRYLLSVIRYPYLL